MDWTEPQLLRARRAYELGRLRRASRAALIVLPMIGLSLVACSSTELSLGAGAALLLVAIGLGWRGQAYGRAVVPGLLAGSVPLVLPLLLRGGAYCCIGGGCWSVCMVGCIGGGLVAGASVGLAAAAERERAERAIFLLGAATLAGLAGVLGCAIVGAAGIAGMVSAIVVVSLPVAAASRLRWG